MSDMDFIEAIGHPHGEDWPTEQELDRMDPREAALYCARRQLHAALKAKKYLRRAQERFGPSEELRAEEAKVDAEIREADEIVRDVLERLPGD
jgi:hypothetical protein